LKKVIIAARDLDVPKILTFIGRDAQRDIEENLEIVNEVWGPIVDFSRVHNVKLAIEPCPMGFFYPTNIAFAPSIWSYLFKNFSPTMGLCMDPSHMLWQQIDYLRVVKDFSDHIIHFHVKDCEIDRENLRSEGILKSDWIDVLFTGKSGPKHRKITWESPKKQWWRYRLAGLGEIDWKRLFTELKLNGYDSDAIIENEDPVYYGSEDVNKQALIFALRFLKGLLPEA
jgi:sugar phosphate isomerase/epimerase